MILIRIFLAGALVFAGRNLEAQFHTGDWWCSGTGHPSHNMGISKISFSDSSFHLQAWSRLHVRLPDGRCTERLQQENYSGSYSQYEDSLHLSFETSTNDRLLISEDDVPEKISCAFHSENEQFMLTFPPSEGILNGKIEFSGEVRP